LNTAASQVPIFVITKFYGAVSTGLFSMTFKVINVPVTLISGAIAQVMHQRVTVIHNDNPGGLRPFIVKKFFLLLLMTIPMILTLVFFGVELFIFVFGENWAEAGRYAAILSVAIAVRFAVSPLSSVMLLDHNLKKGASWQVCYFITVTFTLLMASGQEIQTFLLIFVGHEVVLYGFYLWIILSSAKARPQPLKSPA